MAFNPEEIRQKARTARENFLNTAKGEEYVEKQAAIAKEQYEKLLELCPGDMEAKIYCAYFAANEAVNVTSEHEPAAKKMMEALDVFAEDLKTSQLSLEEKAELIADITIRVMTLAKGFNEQGAACVLLCLYMASMVGDEAITEQLEELSDEFDIDTALTTRMAGLLLQYPDCFQSTKIRAAVVVACQSGLELLVESPRFALEDSYESSNQKLNALMDAIKAVDPTGYHYIPLPKFKYCDYEVFADFRKELQATFDRSKIGKQIKQHNTQIKDREQAERAAIVRAKTEQYWQENPDRPAQIQAEIERLREQVNENNGKIKELNREQKAAQDECDRQSIPAIQERHKLTQQLKDLEQKLAGLGFFQFGDKKQTRQEIEQTRQAIEKANRDELRQVEKKKEKKEKVTREYRKKIDQVKRDNDKLSKQISNLRKELENPLNL